jgi:hypothetical protein
MDISTLVDNYTVLAPVYVSVGGDAMERVLWSLAQTSGTVLIIGVAIVLVARKCMSARIEISAPSTGRRLFVLGSEIEVQQGPPPPARRLSTEAPRRREFLSV